MSRRYSLFVTILVILALLALIITAAAGALAPDCDRRCEVRVQKRVAHAKWSKAVRAYGVSTLRARMRCESGGDGGYGLSTTGNGFWFAHQFEARAWVGAGGRTRRGRPVGVWSTQPSRLEQDYRAAVWHRKHGGDPWPNCP